MSVTAAGATTAVRVETMGTESLGDRSYLVTDGEVALVVDPQRDIDRVLELAGRLGVRITHVAETHLHNDYVTGGLALARATGATYLVPAGADVSFERRAVADGEVIQASPRLGVAVIATPGHTFHHVAYALQVDGDRVGVFSGGSLLYGSVGRPDLVAPEHTEELAHAQYDSARRLGRELPGDAAIYPTHGFGSFCSATQATGEASTIAAEEQSNPALSMDEGDFVSSLLAGLDAYPAYYAHMSAANAAGPDLADLSPPERVDAPELWRRIDAGEWVVDLRERRAFARSHAAGSFNFGLDGELATYLGWLIPWGTPLTLLGESPEQVAAAQLELARIGMDRPTGAAAGSPGEWAMAGRELRAFRTATFGELAAVRTEDGGPVVLDVRRRLEWEESHIPGALHIPLHELTSRLDELPRNEIWVHCAAGYRASIAASILDADGRSVVAVDDDYDPGASRAGLTVEGDGRR